MLYAFNEFLYGSSSILSGVLAVAGALEIILLFWSKKQKKNNKEIKNNKVLMTIVGLFFVLMVGMVIYANELVRVPDVTGKLYSDAKGILIECGLDFNTFQNKEGRIVKEQSIKKDTPVTKGTRVDLIIEEEPIEPTTTPVETTIPKETTIPEWSEWIPSDYLVDNPKYEYETKNMEEYRYRTRTTKTSTVQNSDYLGEWKIYNIEESWGNYGAWSDWSIAKYDETEAQKVESKEQFRYQDKETAISSSVMPGWTLYNTTEEWGDYGAWSDWSEVEATASDERKVEKKEQYRSRSKITTIANTNVMSGWNLYDTTFIWGDWSNWLTTKVEASDNREVETEEVYQYRYRRTLWYSSSGVLSSSRLAPIGYTLVSSSSQVKPGSKTYCIEYSRWVSEVERPEGIQKIGQDGKPYTAYMVDAITYYLPEESQLVETKYRYRDKVYTYYFWQWGNWSDWSDTKLTASDNVEVGSRTIYRYTMRDKVYTYYFWRWSDWSDWSDTMFYASDTRNVEKRILYRFATREKIYTYYFEKYSAWSEWILDKPEDKENREIESRPAKYYRYREKVK